MSRCSQCPGARASSLLMSWLCGVANDLRWAARRRQQRTAQQRNTNVRCEGQLQVLRTKVSALRPSSARCAIRCRSPAHQMLPPEFWLHPLGWDLPRSGWWDIQVESKYIERVVLILNRLESAVDPRRITGTAIIVSAFTSEVDVHSARSVASHFTPGCSCPAGVLRKLARVGCTSGAVQEDC